MLLHCTPRRRSRSTAAADIARGSGRHLGSVDRVQLRAAAAAPRCGRHAAGEQHRQLDLCG
jgi:hypothetical protein